VSTTRHAIAAGLMYLGSALAASAAPVTQIYTGVLGPEAPGATGTGSVIVRFTLDPVADIALMQVQSVFSGLGSPTAVAHIHCCTAVPLTGAIGVATPVPTFPGFPSGVSQGMFDQTYDMLAESSYRPGFLIDNGGLPTALAVLLAGMDDGRAYFNIHTSGFPGGEIRAFLTPIPVPASVLLFGGGLLGMAAALRRRRP